MHLWSQKSLPLVSKSLPCQTSKIIYVFFITDAEEGWEYKPASKQPPRIFKGTNKDESDIAKGFRRERFDMGGSEAIQWEEYAIELRGSCIEEEGRGPWWRRSSEGRPDYNPKRHPS